MAEDALKPLIRKRGHIKGSLTRLINSIKESPLHLSNMEDLAVRENRLITLFASYEAICYEICTLTDEDSEPFTEIEEKYMSSLANLRECIAKMNQTYSRDNVKTKLPVINIPNFTDKRALALENSDMAGRYASNQGQAQRQPPRPPKVVGMAASVSNPASVVVASCMFCAGS
ncbi:unnamed protein product [Arctia plantaginis]|uniref:Uncharacterized protein n=1 Tax=Arctia plantaginis TaxID=874455 RepID=A0A8S1A7D8_ARCPL|nr:unnamed protein product [Arctia plantaginis]